MSLHPVKQIPKFIFKDPFMEKFYNPMILFPSIFPICFINYPYWKHLHFVHYTISKENHLNYFSIPNPDSYGFFTTIFVKIPSFSFCHRHHFQMLFKCTQIFTTKIPLKPLFLLLHHPKRNKKIPLTIQTCIIFTYFFYSFHRMTLCSIHLSFLWKILQ